VQKSARSAEMSTNVTGGGATFYVHPVDIISCAPALLEKQCVLLLATSLCESVCQHENWKIMIKNSELNGNMCYGEPRRDFVTLDLDL